LRSAETVDDALSIFAYGTRRRLSPGGAFGRQRQGIGRWRHAARSGRTSTVSTRTRPRNMTLKIQLESPLDSLIGFEE